ncbi:MAG: hypothetical protein KY428_04660 [Bacteroidetes bacterium]|nr:hypothetical protein [Bacteroidota bacterium]
MKKVFLYLMPLLAACQSEPAQIPGFEAYVWKRDKFGCGGERKAMADTLLAQRDLLMQLSEQEVTRLLGQPDARELFIRNQKFLIYFIEPGVCCQTAEDVVATDKTEALHIRLNALGSANELYISPF